MSRGHGALQWRLLTILSEHERTAASPTVRRAGLDTITLAQRVHGREPTRSELVSIRRALAVLAHAGEVSNLALRHGHRHHWVYIRRSARTHRQPDA